MERLKLSVIGLGFIGLPLSLSYAMKGAKVIGIDVLDSLVDDINKGISYHLEYYKGKSLSEILQEQIAAGRFKATTNYEETADQVDTYMITVGIPVRNGDPDMSHIIGAAQYLAKVLKKGDLVILRSTVIPGTTEEVVKPILEESGLIAGVDFDLAYASERIAEGRAFEEFINMPLTVGGVNQRSAERAKKVLSFVTEAEIHIASIKVVETAKVIENIQRDVNIAMVQEFARLAEKMGIDTFELIKTANTHKRVNLLVPGPGVGGYCLPNALYYLLPKAEENQVSLNLLKTARLINDRVPEMLVAMMKEKLEAKGKSLSGAKIAVFGLAMKDYSNDDRISPAHQVVEHLLLNGAVVKAYDPAVPTEQTFKVDNISEAVEEADGLFLLAMQKEFEEINWIELFNKMTPHAVVIDTKNRIPQNIELNGTIVRI